MKVRPAELTEDRETLIRLLTENLPQHGGEPHFDWLYLRNPAGKARVWLVEESPGGEPIGVAAAFPRRARARDEELVCWNLGDFAISKRHRSLGPAVALQRACLEQVMTGEVAFAYDHPRSNMLAIYRRLGIAETGSVVRFAKPLRFDERFRSPAVLKPMADGVAAIGNLLLRTLDAGKTRAAGADRVSSTDRVDARFDDLDRRAAPQGLVRGTRGADYLRWRYLENPNRRYELLTADRGESLAGFAAFYRSGDNGVVADLLADDDPDVLDALIAGLIEVARQRELRTLSFPLLQGNALAARLSRWGFRARESSLFVVTTARRGAWDGTVTRADCWYLTDGDRDV